MRQNFSLMRKDLDHSYRDRHLIDMQYRKKLTSLPIKCSGYWSCGVQSLPSFRAPRPCSVRKILHPQREMFYFAVAFKMKKTSVWFRFFFSCYYELTNFVSASSDNSDLSGDISRYHSQCHRIIAYFPRVMASYSVSVRIPHKTNS